MAETVIRVEHLSKRYELGVIGRTTLQRDFARWWARVRGEPDPTLKIGQEALAARYGESILALDDVSFEVKQGEALGIIGRNGAGKSTLLKILSRVTAPTSGVVKVKGRIGSLLEVGTGFHPELTGRENVYLNGTILGMTRAEIDKKFDAIVDFSGVEQFIDTPVKRYSSGMHVRLGFAVAAHLDPEILIVDEVLAVGDAEFQKKCLGKMGDVAGEGRTVLFVTHNLRSVKKLCNNGLLFEEGKSIYKGSVSETIQTYQQSIIKYSENQNQDLYEYEFPNNKYIKKLKIETYKHKKSNTISMGEGIILLVGIENFEKINNARLGIAFNDAYGERVFVIDTDMVKEENRVKFSKRNCCIFKIPKIPLLPGDYFLDIILAKRNDRRIEICEDAMTLKILPSDYFRNSYQLTKNHGIIFHDDFEFIVTNLYE